MLQVQAQRLVQSLRRGINSCLLNHNASNELLVKTSIESLQKSILSCRTSPYFSDRMLSITAPSYIETSQIPPERLATVLARAGQRRAEHLQKLVAPTESPAPPQLMRLKTQTTAVSAAPPTSSPPAVADSSFKFPGFTAWFQNSNPVHLEICSGYGQWIAFRAQRDPHLNYVACELDLDRALATFGRVLHLPNVRIMHGDARSHLRHFVPSASLASVYINFPEPAFKKKHQKWKLVDQSLLQSLHAAMLPQACLNLTTDHPGLNEQMLKAVQDSGLFKPLDPAPALFVTKRVDYGESRYEQIWRAEGRTIHYSMWQKL